MKRKLKAKTNAKINLSLNVSGKTKSGMHLLDSITTSVDLTDVVTVCERSGHEISVSYNGVPSRYENDSVKKALSSLAARFGPFGLDVAVEKRLPEGAGIGGSSADAAAVLRLAHELFGFFSRGYTYEDAEKVGSDVPVMLSGGYNRLTGTGAKVRKLSGKELHLVLVAGGAGVSTAECYKLFDSLYPSCSFSPADNEILSAALEKDDLDMVAKQCKNALFAPAAKLNERVAERLALIDKTKALCSFMTGSGSGCLGLYDSHEAALKAAAELEKFLIDGEKAYPLSTVPAGIVLL